MKKSLSGEECHGTKVIYHIETVEWVTMKSGVATVVRLVDEDGMNFKAFAIGSLEGGLKDFGWGEGWFINSLGKRSSSKDPIQSYYYHEIMRR